MESKAIALELQKQEILQEKKQSRDGKGRYLVQWAVLMHVKLFQSFAEKYEYLKNAGVTKDGLLVKMSDKFFKTSI